MYESYHMLTSNAITHSIGRYRAILIFSSIYLFGLVLVVFGSIPDHVSPAVFFPAIYIVALGMLLFAVCNPFGVSNMLMVRDIRVLCM
ncbi:hypothetical protein EON63_13030 [archaeon]|nr:MAG: hypothetical protein EON63_13030 [archaeon]